MLSIKSRIFRKKQKRKRRDDAQDEKKNENLIASECWWIDNGNAC